MLTADKIIALLNLKPHPEEGRGMQTQGVVPGGVWQGARLIKDGTFALLGATVSPGFELADYESGCRDELVKSYPKFQELIIALTKR